MSAERHRDEHGRAFFAFDEVPPDTEHFAFWRGRLTHPSASTGHSPSTHATHCVGGWIPSGEWWLHCGVCRPKAKA